MADKKFEVSKDPAANFQNLGGKYIEQELQQV